MVYSLLWVMQDLHHQQYCGIKYAQTHIKDGLLGPNSRMVVCMDPLG